MASHNSLVLENVCKVFGRRIAVDRLCAAITEGSICGLLGPNGAGKTTIIRMIMSILYPDSGHIRIFDQPPERVKDRIGYLPEEKGLYKKMKTVDMVAWFGRLKGMNKHAAGTRAHQLLEQFGIGDCAEARCETLSKGMSQKVQILSTLLHDPALIILDEPFSGLDPINVEMVRSVIVDLKRAGKTVIFSTHVMEQAEQICDTILLVNGGRKILDGTLAEVRQNAARSVRIEYEGCPADMAAITGIARVNDMGRAAELSLTEDADARAIMHCLMEKMVITQFSVKAPTLHEIFLRAVRESPE